MADNYKILAQTTAASVEPNTGSNQANVVYTVPENTQVAVSSISLVNTSAVAEDYYLGVVKASDVDSSIVIESNITSTVVPTYVALSDGSNKAAYSTDGVSWVERNLQYGNWREVAYGNGLFVGVAYFSSNATTSTDGITWTQRTLPAYASWASVAYGNGLFVAIAGNSSNIAAYSTNGITWTQTTLPATVLWNSVTYAAGKFVAVGRNSVSADSPSAVSTNGIIWTSGDIPAILWSSVTYGNGVFVAVNERYNYAATSTNGYNWILRTLPTDSFWSSVTYGNGVFVAIGYSPTAAATSTDGITWTARSLPANAYWTSVTYGDGKFVAVAYSPYIAATSTDGITWTQRTIISSGGQYSSVAYGNPTIVSGQSYSLNALSINQTIIPTRSIEPNTVDEVSGGITLSAGDQIRVYSESDDLVVQVYGVELS